MAQMVLGGIGGLIGGGVGHAIGVALGGVVDRGLIGALSPARQRGPRLETLRIQSTAEGAPMVCAKLFDLALARWSDRHIRPVYEREVCGDGAASGARG